MVKKLETRNHPLYNIKKQLYCRIFDRQNESQPTYVHTSYSRYLYNLK
jgi:hypothetical protein